MLPPQTIKKILKKLADQCPEATTELTHRNPFQLLIATILSAQCTDKRVNQVTPPLFRDFKTPQKLAAITASQLEPYIKTCGLYRSKAKNIIAACQMIVRDFKGKVPQTLAELQKLPGVGRKTANVVASHAFGVDAIAVDTHVFRVSNRIGLAHAKTVEQTEEQLMETIPQKEWSKAHHWLIYHGRNICHARKPICQQCPIEPWCTYDNKL